ncbi:MAG TPA: LLM class flavin-dependent oxidoreductase [Candidatus Bathyarchaeota archaeon]|nr:LLM class flavin-dependent oxidoreductase [Candidatus Bathyarchaeota archaeon]
MLQLREFGVHMLTTKHEVSKLLEYGVKLERWGFDHLKVGDHTLTMNPNVEYPNAHTLLSAIGVLTKRIKLSTAVTDPLRRHPVEIAQGIATLDRITKGRVALGIGAGEAMNLAPFGIEAKKPYTALREAVQVIKMLWLSSPDNPADFKGEVFRLDRAYLQLKCYQKPHPPVYIGALSPKTRELAGELAEGWIAVALESPKTLKVHLREVERGLAKSGRRLEDFYVSATVYTEVGDFEEAYRTVEWTARRRLASNGEILALMGHKVNVPKEVTIPRIRVDDKEALSKLDEIAKSIPRKIVEQILAIGNPDQCIAKLEEYVKAGANSLIICSLSRDDDRLYRLYSEKILPYMKEIYGS